MHLLVSGNLPGLGDEAINKIVQVPIPSGFIFYYRPKVLEVRMNVFRTPTHSQEVGYLKNKKTKEAWRIFFISHYLHLYAFMNILI